VNSSISKNFILFFLLSVIFWFLTKLSKEYDSTLVYPIEYENLPQDKLLQETPQNEVAIHVNSSGFKILSGKIFPRTLKVDASALFLKSKNEYFLLLSQQRGAIQRQMNDGVEIDHFIQDSIVLDLGFLSQKKVPVQLNSELSYQTGFDLQGELTVTPDSVTISGPESILDTIEFVETVNLIRTEVHKSIEERLALQTFDKGNNLKLSESEVTIKADVEKFTENTQTVPFVILNLPSDVTISTFPKEVQITYKVALSNFNEINPSSFLVECDYQLSAENNLLYLVPKLARKPDLVKNVKISPNRIEFVIEK
jgi:hypothetical protein